MKKGFTLVEILVAVMIVVVLVTMAAPMYDKAIEKSRIAEARVTAKKLWDAKARMLDTAGKEQYNSKDFDLRHLDFTMPCESSDNFKCITKDFVFSINPGGSTSNVVINGICAVRRKGDYAGTSFLYVGEDAPVDSANDASYGNFWCSGSKDIACDAYAMKDKKTGLTWSCPQ